MARVQIGCEMTSFFSAKGIKSRALPFLVMAAVLTIVSCTGSTDQSETAQQSNDPAQANLAQAEQAPASEAPVPASAPVSRTPARPPQAAVATQPYSTPSQPYPAQYPSDPQRAAEPQNDRQTNNQSVSFGNQNPNASYAPDVPYYPEESGSNDQSMEAEQPPPPLLQYTQPQCPGDNYLWTPGYWAYAPAGYFWVPGAWVVAPYVGALWTPPYWAYGGSRYHWHRGFWGQHIGFYGGINYGFGYFGRGYEGGYWDRNRRVFNYNRSVNNLNTTLVHNVYNYRVVNNITTINNTRISYNGGRGGVEYRPSPQELAVLREQRLAPVQAQTKHMQQAAVNRAQFANANHGRPEVLVTQRPLATAYREPASHPLAVPEARSLPQFNTRQQVSPLTNTPAPASAGPGFQPAGRPGVQPNAPAFAQSPAHPPHEHGEPQGNFAPRPGAPAMNSQVTPGRPEAHPVPPTPVARPETRGPQRAPEQRPVPETRFEQRSAPRPQAEQRPAPPLRVEQPVAQQPSPAPQPRVEPAPPTRPVPQPRVEQRPAPPPPRAEQAPSPHVEARPQPRVEPRQETQPHIEQRQPPRPEPAPGVKPPAHTAPPRPDEHDHHG